MEPTYIHGQKVLAVKKYLTRIEKNDIVVAKDPRSDRLLIKRLKEIKSNQYFIVGDNEKESTDSRKFGWIQKSDIIGKVTMKLSS